MSLPGRIVKDKEGKLAFIPDRRVRRSMWRASRRGEYRGRDVRGAAWRASWQPLRGDL